MPALVNLEEYSELRISLLTTLQSISNMISSISRRPRLASGFTNAGDSWAADQKHEVSFSASGYLGHNNAEESAE